MLRAERVRALACAALLAAACAEPPETEIHQAEGAIAAARAAGAEQYARQTYDSAVAALKRAEAAVAQRDYRLALNHALDSRERAQNAAKETADQKALVRSESERALNEIAAVLAQATGRLKYAESLRVPTRGLSQPRRTVATAAQSVQETRALLARGDYHAARQASAGVADKVRAAIRDVDGAIAAQPRRRRRT